MGEVSEMEWLVETFAPVTVSQGAGDGDDGPMHLFLTETPSLDSLTVMLMLARPEHPKVKIKKKMQSLNPKKLFRGLSSKQISGRHARLQNAVFGSYLTIMGVSCEI